MATKKTKTSELNEAASIEGLLVFATDNQNNSVKAPITLLKGNKGDKGDAGAPGAPGTAGKAPRVNGSTGMWEVWDNNTSAWVSTGVDASSGYTLTEEAVRTVLGSAYAPVNEIRYSTEQAGNIFGDKYLKCDGSLVSKTGYPELLCEDARTLDRISVIHNELNVGFRQRPFITPQNEILSISEIDNNYYINRFDFGTKTWNQIMQIPDTDNDPDRIYSDFSNIVYNNLTGRYAFLKIRRSASYNNYEAYSYTTDLETISETLLDKPNFVNPENHAIDLVCCDHFYTVQQFASLYYSEDLTAFTPITSFGSMIGAQVSFVNNRVVLCLNNGRIYVTGAIENAGIPEFVLKLETWTNYIEGFPRSTLQNPTKCFFLNGKYVVSGINMHNLSMTVFIVTEDFENWILGGNFQWTPGGGKDRKIFVHNDEFYVWNHTKQIVRPIPPDYNYQTTIELQYVNNGAYLPSINGEIVYIDGKLYTIYGSVALIDSGSLKLPFIENAYIKALE